MYASWYFYCLINLASILYKNLIFELQITSETLFFQIKLTLSIFIDKLSQKFESVKLRESFLILRSAKVTLRNLSVYDPYLS